MVIRQFPPIEATDEYGLLAVGGDLDTRSLLLAYRSGIFPWPFDDELLAWFAPPQRAILFIDRLHQSRSLRRAARRMALDFKVNHAFATVVKSCAELKNRGGQGSTWITPSLRAAYIKLHQAGHAFSFEAYQEGELVGGCYGVWLGRMFAAESSFYRRPNASKLALCYAAAYLKEHGVQWLDCQVLTPLSASLGAIEINRSEFMLLLEQAVSTAAPET